MGIPYNALKTEEEILSFWKENRIYEKAKERNRGKKSFYFLDGPPYTSGKIHIGTTWNKVLKDSVLRYKRMRGFDVWDRAGYDMHGLPTELKVQAELGLKSKEDIPMYGISRFIEACKDFSIKNMNIMNKDFKRLGVWMDFDNAYRSIVKEFIEGEWMLIKKAEEKGRLYEGRKVMHWCSHCATSLAKHELEYKTVKDTSIFVKFKLRDEENTFLIIWTTTPWTIPFNLGVMVNPEVEYVKARVDNGEQWIVALPLAVSLISGVAGKKYEIMEKFKGSKLNGLHYIHPFSDTIEYGRLVKGDIHRVVLSEEYVETTAGSGLVHMAPGCGPEDYEVGRREGMPPFNNIDEYGVFPPEMGEFRGLVAKRDDEKFIQALEDRGVLVASTPVEHEYAHCWRCKKPVVFRTTSQWFFKVEDLSNDMRKLNREIKWVPEWAGSRQFDNWLMNIRDNGITRQRYWGSPAPIWKCNKCGKHRVVGSLAELRELSGMEPEDLHKPYIDRVKFKCECGGTMERIPDVLDVWIDAGTTSWTCLNYPKEKKLFEELYPADFILEGKDQIRGWFNLLFVAGMIAFGKKPFKAVYMHGFVNDALGRKMSKSLGNVISPYEAIDKYGADTVRYYSIGGANAGLDLNYNFDDMQIKFRNLGILWNLHSLLLEYSSEAGINPAKLSLGEVELGKEEEYILSLTNSAITNMTESMDSYKINEAPWIVEGLFLELSRFYVKLAREKMLYGNGKEKKAVLFSFYNSFFNSLLLFSPFAPFITERIYLNLREGFNLKEESIHLMGWPSPSGRLIKPELEKNFGIAKEIIQGILSAREKAGIGVRWPLMQATVVSKNEGVRKAVAELKEQIKRVVNIREIDFMESYPEAKVAFKVDYAKLGPDFGKRTPAIISRLMAESPESVLSHLEKEGKFVIDIDGEKVEIVKEHLTFSEELPQGLIQSSSPEARIYIDTRLSPELEVEGYAREIIRRTQELRKKIGLNKSDRINLSIFTERNFAERLKEHMEIIAERTGTSAIIISDIKSKENIAESRYEGKAPGSHALKETLKIRDKSIDVVIDY